MFGSVNGGLSVQNPLISIRQHRWLCDGDRRLGTNEEPPDGAHLVTPRMGYAHHGIYVGAGTVIHYSGFAYQWHRALVREESLQGFAHGHPVWIRPAGPNALPGAAIADRARQRLGENRYRLLSNNCEHFSEWCVHGEPRSQQVDSYVARLRFLWRAINPVTIGVGECRPIRNPTL